MGGSGTQDCIADERMHASRWVRGEEEGWERGGKVGRGSGWEKERTQLQRMRETERGCRRGGDLMLGRIKRGKVVGEGVHVHISGEDRREQ